MEETHKHTCKPEQLKKIVFEEDEKGFELIKPIWEYETCPNCGMKVIYFKKKNETNKSKN